MSASTKLEIIEDNTQNRIIRVLRRSSIGLILLLILGLAVYFTIPIMLDWLMVHKTPVHPVDVVFTSVGLGSSLNSVVELHKTGMVKKIVVTYDKEQIIGYEGKPIALHKLSMQQIIQKGVPAKDVLSVKWDTQDRVERRLLFRNWILEHNIKSYLAYSSNRHSKFVKFIHDTTFPERNVELVLITYESNRVWRKQILNLQNSLIRMFYWYWIVAPELETRIKQINSNSI